MSLLHALLFLTDRLRSVTEGVISFKCGTDERSGSRTIQSNYNIETTARWKTLLHRVTGLLENETFSRLNFIPFMNIKRMLHRYNRITFFCTYVLFVS